MLVGCPLYLCAASAGETVVCGLKVRIEQLGSRCRQYREQCCRRNCRYKSERHRKQLFSFCLHSFHRNLPLCFRRSHRRSEVPHVRFCVQILMTETGTCTQLLPFQYNPFQTSCQVYKMLIYCTIFIFYTVFTKIDRMPFDSFGFL